MCVILKSVYAIMMSSALLLPASHLSVPSSVKTKNSKKGKVSFMNTKKQKTDQTLLSKILPIIGVLLLLASLSLLSCLASCEMQASGNPPADTSTDDPVRDPDATEGSNEPSKETSDALSDADEKTLLYYVALVEELQEEVRQLKAENFILSASKENAESNAPVSKDPAADYTYEEDDGMITILSYKGSEKAPTVPSEIGGCPVTKIGENAFSDTDVVSVVLPDTLTEIDWFAFANCSSLRSVTAGSSVTTVGYGAFDGCPSSLTLICPSSSYLAKYGKSFGIAVSEG